MVRISKKQKYFTLPSDPTGELGKFEVFRECENGHFVTTRTKYKTYWDEFCPICGAPYKKEVIKI
jgi:hypothetical protein